MDGRAGHPRLEGLYLAVWEGGVWGGEYASGWDIVALTEVNCRLLGRSVSTRGEDNDHCCSWKDPRELEPVLGLL